MNLTQIAGEEIRNLLMSFKISSSLLDFKNVF